MATTFSNRREMASVSSEANGITLTGECQHKESNNLIVSFNGVVVNAQNKQAQGNFYYSEQEGGNINYNITAPSSMRQAVESMMFTIVTDIHTEFDVVSE